MQLRLTSGNAQCSGKSEDAVRDAIEQQQIRSVQEFIFNRMYEEVAWRLERW